MNHKQNGFTLLEITIVLAIISLITVVVFLAVRGAQRSERDAQRRTYANDALSRILVYRSNNGGNAAALTAARLRGYMNNRKINNKVPNVSLQTRPSGTCSTSQATNETVYFGVAPTEARDYVAVCLVEKIWYVVEGS